MKDRDLGGFNPAREVRYLIKRLPVFYRIRYALITTLGGTEFGAPAEDSGRSEVPPEFEKVISRLDLAPGEDFENARKIAFDLSRGHRRGPGLGRRSAETLKRIYLGGAGVCSDYTQALLGLCRAAGIGAREWGLCADFEAHVTGHAFAEIYSPPHGRWVFLDPFFSMYAVRRDDPSPLAVTEMVDLVTAGRTDEIELRLIDPEGKPGAKRDAYLTRYFAPHHAFFLLTNNDVFRQDAFLRWAGIVPPPILHTIMILCGRYQKFRVYTNPRNRDLMRRKIRTLKAWFRRRALFSLGLAVLVLVLFSTRLW